MVTYLILLGFCIVFLELFLRLGVVADARSVVARSREAGRVMASSDLEDDAKEALVRSGSLSIMKATLCMAAKFLLILAVLYAIYRAVAFVVPATGRELAAALVAPVPVVVMTAATFAYAWLRGRIVGRP